MTDDDYTPGQYTVGLTPYLAIGLRTFPLRPAGGWELAGVFHAEDPPHAIEQAHDADPEAVEWIVVPVTHVYRKAVE